MSIPDILCTGALKTTTAGETYTEVIESITFSETGCRFQLKNEGILNHSSKLVLGLVNNASVDRAFFPPNVGVNSLISRATLKIGSKTICETADWNSLQSLKSTFISSQNNKEREAYLSSRCMNYDFVYKRSNASSASNSDSDADAYTLSYGKYPLIEGSSIVQKTTVFDFQLMANDPTFMIDMRDLFPFFKAGHQLPLYLMTESVFIDLTFEVDPFRTVVSNGAAAEQYTKKFLFDRNQCKILQDIIVYDGEVMEGLRQQNDSISFTYEDHQLTKTSVTVDQASSFIRNLGGNGRMVTNLFYMITDEGTDKSISNSALLNKYNALTPDGFSETLTSNIKFNDTFLYPLDQVNTSKHFHNFMRAEGGVPYITRSAYGSQGGDFADANQATFEGYDPELEIEANMSFHGDKLTVGERINTNGIQLQAAWSDLEAFTGSGTIRAWISVMKTVEIKDGITEVYYV